MSSSETVPTPSTPKPKPATPAPPKAKAKAKIDDAQIVLNYIRRWRPDLAKSAAKLIGR